jgi:hypothetical protein
MAEEESAAAMTAKCPERAQFPALAHRVTVLGSTRNMAATSPRTGSNA